MSYIESKTMDYTECDLDSSVFYKKLNDEGENSNSYFISKWIFAAYDSILTFIAFLISYTQFKNYIKIS